MIRAAYLKHLQPGDRVEKCEGYPFPGQIRSVFQNSEQQWRLVVEFHMVYPDGSATGADYATGLLHIFSPKQLELRSDYNQILHKRTVHYHDAKRNAAEAKPPRPNVARKLVRLVRDTALEHDLAYQAYWTVMSDLMSPEKWQELAVAAGDWPKEMTIGGLVKKLDNLADEFEREEGEKEAVRLTAIKDKLQPNWPAYDQLLDVALQQLAGSSRGKIAQWLARKCNGSPFSVALRAAETALGTEELLKRFPECDSNGIPVEEGKQPLSLAAMVGAIDRLLAMDVDIEANDPWQEIQQFLVPSVWDAISQAVKGFPKTRKVGGLRNRLLELIAKEEQAAAEDDPIPESL